MPRGQFWGNPEKVALWMSARPTRNPIIEALRDGFDDYDMYGSTVGVLFAIADVMTETDGCAVPAEWNFRQSPFGADTEDWNYQAIVSAIADGATLEDLEHAGRVFFRLDHLNRLTGIDY